MLRRVMNYQNYSEISYEKLELFRYFMIRIFHTTPGSFPIEIALAKEPGSLLRALNRTAFFVSFFFANISWVVDSFPTSGPRWHSKRMSFDPKWAWMEF